jgi:pentatricopeptide repeat protein
VYYSLNFFYKGIQLNSYFYAIVLDGLINCGQLEEALSLFEDLKKKDLSQMNIKEEVQKIFF